MQVSFDGAEMNKGEEISYIVIYTITDTVGRKTEVVQNILLQVSAAEIAAAAAAEAAN